MTPAARITLDGIDITANLIPAPFGQPLEGGGVAVASGAMSGGPLLSLTVTDNEGKKSDAVDFVIDNREVLPAPKKGSKFEVWLGYAETGLVFMGSYKVDSWTKSGRPLTLQVSATAVGLTTEIKSPKSRSYHGSTVGEIVEKIAGKNKLETKVHPDLKDVKIGHIDQSSESDVHFLTRLATRVGANFKIANGTIIFNKAGSGTLPGGDSAPVFDISETGLLQWSATSSERGSYGCCICQWQNVEKGERKTVTAGSGKPKYRDRKLYKTEDEAQQAAQAQLSGLNRGQVTFTCSMPGLPEMFAGARAQVAVEDPDVDGLFNIKTVVHTLSGQGFITSPSCESAKETGGDSDSDVDDGAGSDDNETPNDEGEGEE